MLTYKDLKIIRIFVDSKIVLELQIIDNLKLVIVILKIHNMNFVHIIDLKTQLTNNFLTKNFDQQGIELKYYNHTNEHIISEYYNYIINSFKNHKFGFPIKTTIFTKNLLYNIKEINNDNKIDVTNITNYQKYFDTNSVKVKDIYRPVAVMHWRVCYIMGAD